MKQNLIKSMDVTTQHDQFSIVSSFQQDKPNKYGIPDQKFDSFNGRRQSLTSETAYRKPKFIGKLNFDNTKRDKYDQMIQQSIFSERTIQQTGMFTIQQQLEVCNKILKVRQQTQPNTQRIRRQIINSPQNIQVTPKNKDNKESLEYFNYKYCGQPANHEVKLSLEGKEGNLFNLIEQTAVERLDKTSNNAKFVQQSKALPEVKKYPSQLTALTTKEFLTHFKTVEGVSNTSVLDDNWSHKIDQLNFQKQLLEQQKTETKKLACKRNSLRGLVSLRNQRNRFQTQPDCDNRFKQYVSSLTHKEDYVVKIMQKVRFIKQIQEQSTITTPLEPSLEEPQQREDQLLNLKTQENKKLNEIGDNLTNKMKYIELFKEKAAAISNDTRLDPRLDFFVNCNQHFDLALPIFEKIINKTLVLQNYQLSKTQCEGLALACAHFNESSVNRIHLSNNGIDGQHFAKILQGLGKLVDFKSIKYKQNQLSSDCLSALEPILQIKVPFHLAELHFIEVKVQSKVVESLLAMLVKRAYIQNLSLVDCNMTERSYQLLSQYVQNNKEIQEIDVSWSGVRYLTISRFMSSIVDNKRIKNLCLKWNTLLEEREQQIYTLKQMEDKKRKLKLTIQNEQTINCICLFIKNNPSLQFLDLSYTGLNEIALKMVIRACGKSLSILAINLSGNQGISQNLINWASMKLQALVENSPIAINCQTKDDQVQFQRQVRLQQILNERRKNQDNLKLLIEDKQIFVMSRKIGHESIIQQASMWTINQYQDYDWVSQKHNATVFLWSRKIGEACAVDNDEIKKQMAKLEFEVQKYPQIAGQFTNWKYKSMLPFEDFCNQNDPNPPDFFQDMVKDGVLRQSMLTNRDGKLYSDELEELTRRKAIYYSTQSLDALFRIIKYKNFNLALIDQVNPLLFNSREQQLFIFIDFVSSGRHNYVIHDDQMYVHTTFVSLRTDEIPLYYIENKPRDVLEVKKLNGLGWKYFLDQYIDSRAKDNEANPLFRFDQPRMELGELEPNFNDKKLLESMIKKHYSVIIDLYTYLRHRSSSYPYLDEHVIRLMTASLKIEVRDLKLIMFQCFDIPEKQNDTDPDPVFDPEQQYLVKRYRFAELLTRISIQVYKDKTNNTSSKCLQKLIQGPLKDFKSLFNYQQDHIKLWNEDSEITLVQNENALKSLYQKLASKTESKVPTPDSVSLPDFITFVNKCNLRLSEEQIKLIFYESKLTIKDEYDSQTFFTLRRLSLIEFFETILRLAQVKYVGSEMENDSMAKKLYYLMDDTITQIGEARYEQGTDVQPQFEDSLSSEEEN